MRSTRKRTLLALALAAVGTAVGIAASDGPEPIPPCADGVCPACPPCPLPDLSPKPDAAIALEWAGPTSATVHRPAEYTLLVRNVCGKPVQNVVVQVKPPANAKVTDTSAGAKRVDSVYLWEMGTLDPKQSKPLKLTLTPTARGDLGCQAWVTCTGTAATTVAVKEPKLEVIVHAPKTVVAGETVQVTYTIQNVGDGPAEMVRHSCGEQYGKAAPAGTVMPVVAYLAPPENAPAVDVLKPGQKTTVTAEYKAGTTDTLTFLAAAAMPDGTSAIGSTKVRVIEPKLTATVVGPAKAMVNRKATFAIKVQNTGELEVADVTVRPELPAGWRSPVGTEVVVAKSLPPGESATMTFDVVPTATGTGTLSTTVLGSRGTKATAECRTEVDGIPALRVELVDLADPVEKGDETTYSIRVTNTGTKADQNLVLSCPIPGQLKLVTGTGPTGYVATELNDCTLIKFDPVRELAPNTHVEFRVTVKAVGTGDVRFKAQISSEHLTTSVVKEESTRVYGN